MSYLAELASRLSQFGRTELDYNLVDPSRPTVRRSIKLPTETPTEQELYDAVADVLARAEADWIAANTPPPDYYAIMQAALDGQLGAGTYDLVRATLKDVGGRTVALGGSITLNVTAAERDPVDVEELLRERIDSQLGAGAYEGVKTVLRAMQIPAVEIDRFPAVIKP